MLQKQKLKALIATEQQGLTFQTLEMEAIIKMKQKYERNVQQAIHIIQDLAQSKMPQKCITHNNNFTLYCEQDQKPLCASCMYQNQTHKLHKILPLANCTGQIRRDCEKLQKQLAFIVQHMIGLVKHVNTGISSLQQQFPQMVWKIQDYYKNLHQFLVDREKQHVNELRYYKQKMKYQHGALSAQLNKISLYIQEKLDQYSRKNQSDVLLVKRNVYDTLKNCIKIVGDQLNIKDEEQPKLHFQVFEEIQNFLHAKLGLFFTKQSKKLLKNTLVSKSSKKDLSKYKEKSSFSPVTKPNKHLPQNLKTNPNEADQKQKRTVSNQKQARGESPNKHKNTNQKPARSTSKTPPKQANRSLSASKIKNVQSKNTSKSPVKNQRSQNKPSKTSTQIVK